MYTESLDNFPSAELMHYNSPQTSADYINNNNNIIDFNIYSQSPPTLTNDYSEHELYQPLHIGQQASLVNHHHHQQQQQQQQQQEQQDISSPVIDDVINNFSPLNNHPIEDFHYTTSDQSDILTASPHGYSENIISTTPLLEPAYSIHSIHSTPLLQDSNEILYSPILSRDTIIFDDIVDIGSTSTHSDFGTPYTNTIPLITPTTPYTPFITTSSPYSVASSTLNTPFAFPILSTPLSTPIEQNADPHLYEESGKDWFSLFDPVKSVNNNYKNISNNNNICLFPLNLNMETISPNVTSIENIDKKVIDTSEIVASVHETSPKSLHNEISTPRSTSLPESPNNNNNNNSPIDDLTTISGSIIDSSKVNVESNNNSTGGIIKTEVIVNQTQDESPSTPDNSKLVPIRPRPHDDDDSVENDSTRRSKRQRTMSISEENEEDENDESEKKYNCPECGRGFNRKFNMQTHRLTHDPNRVKPFACEHPNCGSRFTRKHDLKRHINGIHKGEKVHECTVCRKPFSRKDAWKRHIATCGKM